MLELLEERETSYLHVRRFGRGARPDGTYERHIVLNTAHDGSPRLFETQHPELFRHLAEKNEGGADQVHAYLTLERDIFARLLASAVRGILSRALPSVEIFSVNQRTPRGLVDPNREVVPNAQGVIPAVRSCVGAYPDDAEIRQILASIAEGHAAVDAFMTQHPDAVLGDIHTMWHANPLPGADATPDRLLVYVNRFLNGTCPRPDNLVVCGQDPAVFARFLPNFVANVPYGKPEEMHGIQAGNWLAQYGRRVLCVDIPKANLGSGRRLPVDFEADSEKIKLYATWIAQALIGKPLEVGQAA